jgi:hypothetical protein
MHAACGIDRHAFPLLFAHRPDGPRAFLFEISQYEITMYYASIARQFKVDSAGSGKYRPKPGQRAKPERSQTMRREA